MLSRCKIFSLIICLSLSFVCHNALAKRIPASIVIDAKTGEVLSAHNPDGLRYPASLTKLMTLYITFDSLEKGIIKMDDEFPVSYTAASRSPSRLGVKPKEKIKVRTAINALIIKSANDCATVLAEGLGFSERQFAIKMTEVAKALGMKHTVFKNASGLPNRQQKTTARDMAVLAAALYYHFPQYYDLFSQTEFTYKGKTYYTHNHLLKHFKGADGMKTGYIASAGFNIVTSAQRNGERIFAVTLGYNSQEERDKATSRLMEKGFNKLAWNHTHSAHTTLAKIEHKDFKILEFKEHQKQNKLIVQNNETDFDIDKIWAVQIGAFSNYAKARVYALKIRRNFPQLKNKNIKIEPAQKSSAIVFRSRLTGFDKKEANQVCKDLQKENKSCIVVSIDGNSQLTLAAK